MSKARQRKKKEEAAAAGATSAPASVPAPAAATTAVSNGVTSNGESKAPAPAAAPESLKDQGNRAFAAGDYTSAVELFSDAIEWLVLSPDSAMANAVAKAGVDATGLHLLYSNRSAAHMALKQPQPALEDAERVVQLRPDWPKGHYRRGAALEAMLQFPEAAAAYAAGLERDPNDPSLRRSADDLAALLTELKLTESQLAQGSDANPDADRFELMVRWLKEGGAKFPRLYLQYYSEDYRGVHCLSRIPSDVIILFVPYHQIMTSQVAMEGGIGRQMVEARVELRSKHSYLAAYLLQERAKGADSYWAPYINSLPRVYANMPIFFGPDLLKQLKGSFTLAKIQDRIDSLRAEYDNICKHVPDLAQFTHEEFVWARLAVITRIFGLVIRGQKTDGLVAYADMLNHKKPRDAADTDTRWTFDDSLNGFTITTMRAIERGEQVYDSYGRKCNSRFFVNYGFALEDNEEDNEALMAFACPPDAPALALKSTLTGGKNIFALREFQVPATYRDTSDRERKSRELFSWLRFLHATESELVAIQAADEAMGGKVGSALRLDCIEPVSTRNEAEVLAHVGRAARAALAAFDTTLAQDDAILAANNFPDSNVRNCVVQRRGEKQVLAWWAALADHAIPLLKLPWNELRKHAANYLTSSARDHYITHCVATVVKKSA